MANRYIRNIDEETLAKSIDEVRKTFCEEKCESCPWKLENDKCLLITAENHASERYHERFTNLKKHYAKVSNFLIGGVHSMELYCGGRVSRDILHNGMYRLHDHGIKKEFTAHSALDLVSQIEANRELIEDEIDELKELRKEKDGTLRKIKEPNEDFMDIGKSMAEGFAKGMNE